MLGLADAHVRMLRKPCLPPLPPDLGQHSDSDLVLNVLGCNADALLEQGWQFTTESVEEWVTNWVERRYGVRGNAALEQAWAILTNQSETSVYNGPRGRYFARYVMATCLGLDSYSRSPKS